MEVVLNMSNLLVYQHLYWVVVGILFVMLQGINFLQLFHFNIFNDNKNINELDVGLMKHQFF